MNIEEYINLDSALIMIGFVGLLVIMVIYFGFRVASFLLDQQYHSTIEEEVEKEIKPYTARPQAGQIWYKKVFDEDVEYIPWIDLENIDSYKILEIRYDFIKAENLQNGHIYHFSPEGLIMEYMQDDFNEVKNINVEKTETPEPEVEPIEVSPIPAENIVKIDGKDFILTPVKTDK